MIFKTDRTATGGRTARHVERLTLPADSGAPPLRDVLAAAQQVDPTVTGLALSGTELTVTHREPPGDAARDGLRALLADRERLLALRPGTRPGAEALRDEATPDAEWLRLFRRWAVTELLGREEDA